MSSIFDSVNAFFGVETEDKPKPKKRKESESVEDMQFRNRFREGPSDKPAAKKPTRTKHIQMKDIPMDILHQITRGAVKPEAIKRKVRKSGA